jgi:hypothetical protein
VTRAEVQAIHGELKATPGKANYVVCVIGSLYTRIIEDWELSNMRNPASRVRRFRGRKIERFLSPEERQRVHAVMQAACGSPRGAPATSNRRACGPQPARPDRPAPRRDPRPLLASVDWQHACFKLVDSKTGPRNVPVSAEVMTLLKEIHDRTGNPKRPRRALATGGKLTGLNRTWEQIRRPRASPTSASTTCGIRSPATRSAAASRSPSSARCSATVSPPRRSATPTSPTRSSARRWS